MQQVDRSSGYKAGGLRGAGVLRGAVAAAGVVVGSGCATPGRLDSSFLRPTARDAAASADAGADAFALGTATPSDATTLLFPDVTTVAPAMSSPAEASTGLCTSKGPCVHACPNGGHTTLSGTVFDPAGTDPLYDVAVYVPYQTPSALPAGASCASCDQLYTGGAVAGARTDASGRFTLTDVPDGPGVPLVVQIGKWRRQIVLPEVMPCQDNPQPDGSLRLPRNASEGDLPNIAVSTGGADSLECLLRRVGVDASEYVAGADPSGHVHLFQGAGGATAAAATPSSPASLWDSPADLMPYDIVLLSCEGAETASPNPAALEAYADAGGRVFASHFHYSWFTAPGSPFAPEGLATWTPGANPMPDPTFGIIQTTLPGGAPFPKGQAMAAWLGGVGALAPNGELPIAAARHNADVGAANVASTPWIVADPSAAVPGAPQYFSWDTPVGAPPGGACGRIVYSDLHVGAASGDTIGGVCPASCADNPLTPQEKALEFMLFDLSSCLQPVVPPPAPPPPEAGPQMLF